LLSRLSGDPKFEIAARKAFMAVWERRSSLNLIGNTINVMTGHWFAPGQSGIGAGIDSLYEYALKTSIMVDDDSFMDIWDDAYAAVMQHHRSNDGHFYRNVHLTFGTPLNNLVDSLSAFWPGLQVLAGDVESAIKSHLFYWKLWEKHSAMPEAFNWVNKTAEWHGYPLRPEAIESTYYLYQATKDDFYLDVGERMLKDLNRRTKTPCGFAVIHDVFTGRREDRMESFMLSETLKYLYLLFDTDNAINNADSGTVFTTEGHRLSIPANLRPKQSSKSMQYKQTEFAGANYQCPAYQAFSANGLQAGIRRRPDYDYVSTLVDMPLIKDEGYWSADATCMLPARTSHVRCH
jgi:mannosidase alpha-like ER degradation enhancer 1